MKASLLRGVLVAAMLAGAASACGMRTPVRPPEDTMPVINGAVTAEREKGVVAVHWKRAEHSADGQRVEDLARFVVERRRDGEEYWQHVATIDVVDQEKIRRRRDFSWHDSDAGDGRVFYRVHAVCADNQEGAPVESAPVPAVSAAATPVAGK